MSGHSENSSEKRQFARLQSLCLISFIESDGSEESSPISMARTLDISEGGVKVESHEPVDEQTETVLEIAIKESIFPVRGKVMYCRELSNGNYVIGIQFDERQDEIMSAIKEE